MREHASQLRSYDDQYARYVCSAAKQAGQSDLRQEVADELSDIETALAAFEVLAAEIEGDTPQSISAIQQFTGVYMMKDMAMYENNHYLSGQKRDAELKQIATL